MVRAFLSWIVWRPLARLTYGAFIIHYSWMKYRARSQQAVPQLSYLDWFGDFIYDIFVAYSLALVNWLALERPILNLEHMFRAARDTKPAAAAEQVEQQQQSTVG